MISLKPKTIYKYIPTKWRKYAGIYPYVIPIFGKIYFKRIKSIIGQFIIIKKKYCRVLEVGSGFGLFSANFKLNFPNSDLLLLDIYSNEIKNYINHLFTNKFNIQLYYCFETDIQKKTPYDKNYFDLIFALDVLEHIENPELALEEIFRILKKEGIVFISVPTESKLICLIRFILNKIKPIEKNPHWNGTIKSELEFYKTLKSRNISIIWSKKHPFNSFPKSFSYDIFYLIKKLD